MARRKNGRDIHGIFLLDKPLGVSSNEILQKVKRLFGANKAGHTGALDPLATGMLPICFGEATKFSHYLLESDKRYRVTAKLGVRTDTSDSEGRIIQTSPVRVDPQDVIEKLDSFRGKQKQIPTMFSALKYQGKPLYEYARKGIEVPRQARDIEVFGLIFLRLEGDEVELDVHCSKGTYIRTLIDDLGESLGCGAHVIALRRLYVGHFKNEPMYTWEDLTSEELPFDALDRLLLPSDSAVIELPKVQLNFAEVIRFRQGLAISYNASFDRALVRIYLQDEFIGIGKYDSGQLLPKRLMAH